MTDIIFKNAQISNLLVEQHFHGCFGINFSNCSVDDVVFVARKILQYGIGGIFPTLVTDDVENIKRQIKIIKKASENLPEDAAKILGIHLEGIFINPLKKGIHDETKLLELTVKNYKLIEDNFIKIVTLAPELDKGLQKYLKRKGVKVQAGHCVGGDLSCCDGVTHTFNAMEGVSHKKDTTALSALTENLYAEIIADGVHVNKKALDLFFKMKSKNKVLLISDCLPVTKSDLKQVSFAGKEIYYDGKKATSKDGVLAGSTMLLTDIVRKLSLENPEKFSAYVAMASLNQYKYHKIKLNGKVWWDEKFNILAVEKDGIVLCKK